MSNISTLMNKVGCTKWPERWNSLFDEVEADFNANSTVYTDPAYYQDLLNKLGLQPEECLMVGNDAQEDMAAQKLGIHVFLLPKWLVNRHNLDISSYPQGDFDDLIRYIDTLQKMD